MGTNYLNISVKCAHRKPSSLFVVMHSSMRFVIEFFREPDLQIGFIYGLTLGQWINLVMFSIGIIFFVNVNRKVISAF